MVANVVAAFIRRSVKQVARAPHSGASMVQHVAHVDGQQPGNLGGFFDPHGALALERSNNRGMIEPEPAGQAALRQLLALQLQLEPRRVHGSALRLNGT